MPIIPRLLGILAVMSCLGLSAALAAAAGLWKFAIDKQDQPSLSYLDRNGKTVFYVGCGGHFVMWAVYPGAAKKDGDQVGITIANAKTAMDFAGEIDGTYTDGPPHTTEFTQADLGYARTDPELYEEKWHNLEARFFDLLDSKEPLTVSAGGKSYVLPAVNAPQWRQRFRKIC
jgi:hypothetical protein